MDVWSANPTIPAGEPGAPGGIPRENVVVLDNGTGYLKAGFAGDNFPRINIPAMVGRPLMRADKVAGEIELKDIMCGDECLPVLSQLNVHYPVKEGKVVNDRWEDMDALWDYAFNSKLNVDTENSLVLLTEAPRNGNKNRIQYCQYMFEKYGFQGLFLSVQAVLTLYAQGLLTGVVLDSGDGVTHAVPVYEGVCLPAENNKGGTQMLRVAGRHVTQHLQKLLEQSGYNFNIDSDMELLKDIKEKCCFVSCDPVLDNHLADETTFLNREFKLPDGRMIGDESTISLARERFQAAECLFNPGLIGVDEGLGMSELLFKCITESPVDIRIDLFRHIVLSGGSTMYPGLPSRLQTDISHMYVEMLLRNQTREKALSQLAKTKISIASPPRRKHMVFSGGAVLADIMKDNPAFWFTKPEYDEIGPEWALSGPGFQQASNFLGAKFRAE